MPTTNDNNPYNEELNHSAVAVIGDIVTPNAKQNSLNLLNNQIKLPPIITTFLELGEAYLIAS